MHLMVQWLAYKNDKPNKHTNCSHDDIYDPDGMP